MPGIPRILRALAAPVLVLCFLLCAAQNANAQVTHVTAADSNRTLETGDHIVIDVVFAQTVTVTIGDDLPYIELAVDGGSRRAYYLSGSGSTALHFSYTVGNGDATTTLNYTGADALHANTSAIDIGSGTADLTLPDPVSTNALQAANLTVTDNAAPALVDHYVTGNLTTTPRPFINTCNDGTGFVFIEFDEGVFNMAGAALAGSDFSISPGSGVSVSFCNVRNENGGTLTGGETVIRLEFFLIIPPGSRNSEFGINLANPIQDTSGNVLPADLLIDTDADQLWTYNLDISSTPVNRRVKFGRGNCDAARDPNEQNCTDHDHIENLPFYIFEEHFPAAFDEITIYEKYIGQDRTWYLVIVEPPGGTITDGVLTWSPVDADDDLQRDYILRLRPVDPANLPPGVASLNIHADMRAQSSFDLPNIDGVSGFEVIYGPVQLWDITPPEIVAVSSITSMCPSSSVPDISQFVSATDDIDTDITITQNVPPGTTLSPGDYPIRLTAADDAGNTDTAVVTITIGTDTTPPLITGCPSDFTVAMTSGMCTAIPTWPPPAATDNCEVISLSSIPAQGSAFDQGVTTVVYTATDAASNTGTCSFTVTVIDDEAPGLGACPSSQTLAADDNCEATAFWTPPTATDNCDNPDPVAPHSSGSSFGLGTNLVVYVATDNSGNTASCTFSVTVSDQTPPNLADCPTDFTVSTDPDLCSAVVSWSPPTASDNCELVSLTSLPMPETTFDRGTTTVVYTATDMNGNAGTCSFTVTVVDNDAPALAACPSSQTLAADDNCEATAFWTPPTATDNCDNPDPVAPHSSGSSFGLGTNLVVYVATDNSGNTASCTFSVTVSDQTPPSLAGCPTDFTVSTAPELCSAMVSWTPPTASDNCELLSLTSLPMPGTTFDRGTTTVVYTATDMVGNTGTCSFTVKVVDDEAPGLGACPSSQTLAADDNCEATAFWTPPTATDNCDNPDPIAPHSSGSSFGLGTNLVVYVATDNSGNTASCTFSVTVSDQTPPNLADCPTDFTVSTDPDLCSAVVSWPPPTASDNCELVSLTSLPMPGTTFDRGTTTVVYTATDMVGNTGTCSFTVKVVDDEPPGLGACPSSQTLAADDNCEAMAFWTPPTFVDNCDVIGETTTHDPGALFVGDSTTVIYTAEDDAGNTTSCSFSIEVVDVTVPEISGCPNDFTVTAGASGGADATWDEPTASDQCAVTDFPSSHSPGTTFDIGLTTVTYTAVDDAENRATCEFTVTVIDVTPPTLSNCPVDQTIAADANCMATATWTPPTADDNSGAVDVSFSHAPGATLAIGTTVVNYQASDGAGNLATCRFSITVEDRAPPTINNCPGDVFENLETGSEVAVDWTAPSAVDNCSLNSLTPNHPPGALFPNGTAAIVYTASDAAGNTSTCTFDVIVSDTGNPVISNCPADIDIAANAACEAVVTWTEPTATDNDEVISFESSHDPGDTFSLGSTQVSYTAQDNSGNESICIFTVNVVDETSPVLSDCPGDIVVDAEAGLCDAVVNWTPPTADDNCPGATLESTHDPNSRFDVGVTTVRYTLTDGNSNTDECVFLVTLHDLQPPAISNCPLDFTVSTDPDLCSAVVTWPPPAVSDNCPEIMLSSAPVSGTTFDKGATTVLYTATDAAGNFDTCSFTVVVVDTESPGSSCRDTTALLDQSTMVAALAPADINDQSSDNCAIAKQTLSQSELDCDDFPAVVIVLTTADDSGNTSTCTASISISYAMPESPTLSVSPGWNLIGLPVTACDTAAEIFSDVLAGSIWHATGNAVRATNDRLATGEAFWFFSDRNDDDVGITGNAPADGSAPLQLVDGWNLIAPLSNVTTPYDGAVKGSIWRWRGNRFETVPRVTGILDAGVGYWINSNGNRMYPAPAGN